MSESANPYEPVVITARESLASQGNYEGLAGTATGLKTIYFGILLLLLCVIGMLVAAFTLPVAAIALGFLMLVGYLMLIIGPFFCLTAPEETGAKGLIIGSIACQVVVLFLSVAPMLGIAIPEMISSVSGLVATIGSTLFVLFMMKIAGYIHRDDLRLQGRTILLGAVLLFVLMLASIAGVAVFGAIASGFTIGVAVGILVLFVMYANLVNALYKAINSRQR